MAVICIRGIEIVFREGTLGDLVSKIPSNKIIQVFDSNDICLGMFMLKHNVPNKYLSKQADIISSDDDRICKYKININERNGNDETIKN